MGKEYVKNYIGEIKNIEQKQKEIEEIVANLPTSSWKSSLEVSCFNFSKKLSTFLEIPAELTAEQKEAIKLIKSGKVEVSKILASVEESPRNDETETEPTKAAKPAKPAKPAKSVKKDE